jgi:hypothetical protein
MQITVNTDTDTLNIIQDYLDEIQFTGTPEEYFEKNCDRLLKNIIKDRWQNLHKNKSIQDKIKDIKEK